MCRHGVYVICIMCAMLMAYLLFVPCASVSCVLFCVCASCVLCGHVWEGGECWVGGVIVGVCAVCVSGSGCGASVCG